MRTPCGFSWDINSSVSIINNLRRVQCQIICKVMNVNDRFFDVDIVTGDVFIIEDSFLLVGYAG